MAAERQPQLLRLAEAVSDREAVAWEEERSAAGDLGATVAGLEQLHALAGAFAGVQSPAARVDQAQPLGRWAHLELINKIGEGAFSEVFRARDPNLDREVALKLRRAGAGPAGASGRRLLEEARRLARIRHPNVVAVHGADLAGGRVGIWTELVEGQTLEDRLDQDGPLGAGEAVAVGLDLCRALAAVHATGLVHGDVKTANVLRERGGRIVLTDLGSATEAGAPAVTGSPASLAPEVLEGHPATPSADLYSLGVLLFRLLTDHYPADPADADRSNAANRRGGQISLRDLRPDLPLELVQVVEQAANRHPERRFQSAGALEQALAGLSGKAPVVTESVVAPARRRPAVLIAVLAAAVGLAAVLGLVLWPPTRPPEVHPSQATQPMAEAVTAGAPATVVDSDAGLTSDSSAAAEPAAPAVQALDVKATMFRSSDGEGEALAEGARVRPGDRLYVELESAEPVYAWVVNEDLEGDLFVLFPIAGLDEGNPLPAGAIHRLPGRLSGVPQEWQVTSAGGRERFLVIAARDQIPEVERELANLVAADPATVTRDRGVGVLRPAPAAGRGQLDDLVQRLADLREDDGSVWLMRLELVNP